MSINLPANYLVRPFGVSGTWRTDGGRFSESARILLADLEQLAAEIEATWPGPKGSSIDGNLHPELFAKARKRDAISDAVKIFAAMAVEGFLNFYGVVRLGQATFDADFERMSTGEKLRELLKECDSVVVKKTHSIFKLTQAIAGRRNDLLHPKTKEFAGPLSYADKNWLPIPGDAQAAVRDMGAFFKAFAAIVPEARFLLPDGEQT